MSPAPPTAHDRARGRAVVGTATTLGGVAVALGLVGILNTGVNDLGADSAETLFVFLVHPVTALIWLGIGLVGVAMASSARRARRFLLVTGPVLVAWAVLALVLGDAASQVLTRDAEVVALDLIGGLAAVAAAVAPLPNALVGVLVGHEEDGSP